MSYLSFQLSDEFVEGYVDRKPDFGFPIGGGNSLGELTFYSKYSRQLEDGSKERWYQACRRVVEGMFSILKDHCKTNRTPWNEHKAQRSAQEAYDRMFLFKWLPPGRGLENMGTLMVNEERNPAPLYNCSFLSTAKISSRSEYEATLPFCRLMEQSMNGIGVGFDVEGAGNLTIHQPINENVIFEVPDSREGWVESIHRLLVSYFFKNRQNVLMDCSKIRAAGEPIKRFGGTAPGPGPLIRLHTQIQALFEDRDGEELTTLDILDLMNMIGKAVVSGGRRRSAELALGSLDDKEFLNAKNREMFPERNAQETGWGHLSNNTVINGPSVLDIIDNVALNGEPGIFNRDLARRYGRLIDPPNNRDHRVVGLNPCLLGTTRLLTKEYGLKPIGELAQLGEFHVWNGSQWSLSHAWGTGVKPVMRVEVTDGRTVELTGNHVVEVRRIFGEKNRMSEEVEVEVKDLLGERLMPCLGDASWRGSDAIDPDTAIFYGLIQGDGTFGPPGAGRKGVSFKNFEPEVVEFLNAYAATHDLSVSHWSDGSVYLSGDSLLKELDAFGFNFTTIPDRQLPSALFEQNPLIVRSFLKGLYSANGAAQPKYARISLKTTCRDAAGEVQQLLSALGLNAYITMNSATEIEWDNGVYLSRESYDVNLGTRWGYRRFQDEIGFLHAHKSVQIEAETTGRMKSSVVKSVEGIGNHEVFDFVEPETHWGWANGIKVHNCAEICLESHELCVSGDTLIQTWDGLIHIEDLVDSTVKVFNGKEWSPAKVFATGVNDLMRVTLSDGSFLDATPQHKWIARSTTAVKMREVATKDLKPGMVLPRFELEQGGGDAVEEAYTWGWMAGDGFMDNGRCMALVQAPEWDLVGEALAGVPYQWQQPEGYSNPFRRVNVSASVPTPLGMELRDHVSGLPAPVMQLDAPSAAQFMAGWVDTDGAVQGVGQAQHLRLYGSEQKLRDAQCLLRRVGINHATLTLFAPEGSKTNKGTRTYGLWYITIPSYECHLLPTLIKRVIRNGDRYRTNPAHPEGQLIDRSKRQVVVSVEWIARDVQTYCFEEPLEHMGVFGNVLTKQCNLGEVFPVKADDLPDFKRTMKFAYLYSKAVTLLPTPWPETNEVLTRNRRIGTSLSGVSVAVETMGWNQLKHWADEGYGEIQHWDVIYSEWLGVRQSIKTTSIKPGGSVPLLVGLPGGVGWPVKGGRYVRRQRFAISEPYLDLIKAAGYHMEPDVMDPEFGVIFEFPVEGPEVRSEREVSIWEKVQLAAMMQCYWADNAVSATFSFRPDEINQLGPVIMCSEDRLKTMSFLPLGEEGVPGAYEQMPYEVVSDRVFNTKREKARLLDWDSLYADGPEAQGEKFCTSDICEIPQ